MSKTVFVIRDQEKVKDLVKNVGNVPHRPEDKGKEMRRKWFVSCMSMRRNKNKEGQNVYQDRMYVLVMKGKYFWCVNDREIIEGDVGMYNILMNRVKLFSTRVNYNIEGLEYVTKSFYVRIGNLSVNNSRREGLIVEIDVRDSDEDDARRVKEFASSLGIVVNDETKSTRPNTYSSDSRRAWEYLLAIRELA
eukprot:g5788.t1